MEQQEQTVELASPCFDDYRNMYQIRMPNLQNKQYDDEVNDLSNREDFFSLTKSPAFNIVHGSPRYVHSSSGENMYLWVIKTEDVTVAMEQGNTGQTTTRNKLAHTNLTGDNPAYAGGEIWYKTNSSVWISGSSSRFQAKDAQELEAIVKAFILSGYSVCSCGWDTEIDRAARLFREEKWINANE